MHRSGDARCASPFRAPRNQINFTTRRRALQVFYCIFTHFVWRCSVNVCVLREKPEEEHGFSRAPQWMLCIYRISFTQVIPSASAAAKASPSAMSPTMQP